MDATRTSSSRGRAGHVLRRVAGLPGRIAARREHDAAMSDPRIAAEHAFQVAYATTHGKPGCEFCGRAPAVTASVGPADQRRRPAVG
jgi:hypothetical protein